MNAVNFLPHWPVSWWVAIVLAAMVIWVFEAAYRLQRRLKADVQYWKGRYELERADHWAMRAVPASMWTDWDAFKDGWKSAEPEEELRAKFFGPDKR